jgi:Zn-finger nucleic acid-binding protein
VTDPQLISSHVPCTKCGYDLRGLYITGKCPECGTDVVRSVPECPRCAKTWNTVVPLARSEASAGVWSCGRCAGVGFEPGKLRRELSQPGASVAAPPKELDLASQTGVMCGRCRVPARSFLVANSIMIDRCDACGFLWLDSGEFPAVTEYVRSVVGARRIPHEVERLLHDPAALRRKLSESADVSASGIAIEVAGAVMSALGSLLS